jgi:hypothetical protein
MIAKIGQLLVGLGLVCLTLAGLFLVIGHSPESFVVNFQAETLGNFAYGLIGLGLLVKLVGDR